MQILIDGIKYAVLVSASDCDECPMCGEPVCPICNDHYCECDCPGPDSEVEDWGCERAIEYQVALEMGLLPDASAGSF